MYSWIRPFLLCIVCYSTSSIQSSATYYFNTELETAYREILELKTSSATERLTKEQLRDPSNGVTVYLLSLSKTTELIATEDFAAYKTDKAFESAFVKLLNANNQPTSPYHKFCLAEVRMQWAFTKIRFNELAEAAINAKQALGLLNDNLAAAPSFTPTKKSLGLLNIVMGSIPSSYSWIASSLGFKGNIRLGVEMIQAVIDSKSIYFQEASLIKIIAEQYILNKDSNMESIRQLQAKYPNNILYTYLYASVLSKYAQSEKALKVIESISDEDIHTYLPAFDYLHGELLLQHGQYVACRVYLNRFLSNFKGKNLVKDTYFKLFLSYWLVNEDETAMTYWKAIPTVGQASFESDKYAQKIAENNELPNKQLTKIRLCTDGGLYAKGFEIYNLTNLSDFTSKKDKLEYYYRAGRLYQKSGKELESIHYYEKVISLSDVKNTYYFGPNSALQLGYIYVKMKNNERAKYYFNLAIAYKNHEYENSIEQKAKAALNEIK
ncbi:MAG: tetratricopeptide repeat protein [Cytophaga sp.]|uniref:tetratricopeptide repeat protein n=1 Tax=Cytophaga sp. TaxID=29535 RepID=UPI003F8216CC